MQRKEPNRRRAIAGLGAAVLAPLAMPAIAQARTKVAVSEALHLALYTPLYVANRLGLFARHGLDVDIQAAGGIALPVQVLLAQRAQFACTASGVSMKATLDGARMCCLAKIAGALSLFALAKPGVTIRSLSDFKGKTIATMRAPSNTFSMPIYMMRTIGGFEPRESGITFLEMPPGTQAAAVKDGRADIAIAFDWDASIGVTQFGLEVVFSFADAHGPIALSSIFCVDQYAKQNGDTVQRFVNALAEAMKHLHTEPNLHAQISRLEFPQVAPEAVSIGSRNFMQTRQAVPRNPIITQADWAGVVQHELVSGNVKQALPYEQMVDPSFAEKATKQFGLPA